MNWNAFPFLRFTICFVAGIISNIYFNFNFNSIEVFLLLTLFYVLLKVAQIKFRYSVKPFLGFVALAVLFCFGHQLSILRTEKISESHISTIHENARIDGFTGVIVDRVKESKKSYKTLIAVESLKIDSVWRRYDGKILSYLAKDTLIQAKYGDIVVCNSSLSEVEKPKNPAEFNYKRYLAFHNIHHRAFVKKEDYKIISSDRVNWFGSPNIFVHKALRIRAHLVHTLSTHFKSNRELGIAEALILGVKDELENEIVKAYSGVGAMHVLAVSGLHVGLVYQIFVIFFGWMTKRGWKSTRLIKAILLLSFIWAYAFITGLSPSVIRAATMFSFIIVADATGKRTNIYNTLALSAFFLLCINPFLIMEVGFQLSYLAVIGIVYIQPKIYKALDFNNWILDNVWSITCVSIAAQISTFSLGVLYFHQFPTYFFISNLVVIPAAIFILYGGLLVLVFSWNDTIASFFSGILESVIWLVNEIIILINKLPISLIQGIDISIFESWIIYLSIALFFTFLLLKKFKILVGVALLISIFSFIQIDELASQQKSEELIFYSVNNHTAVGLRDGNTIKFIADSALFYNEDKMQFHIQHHWWQQNIENVVFSNVRKIPEIDGNRLIIWRRKKILIYEKPITREYIKPIKVDYLLVRNNPWVDEEKIKANFIFNKLIIDGHNNWKTRNYISKNIKDSYNLVVEGALVEAI